MEAFFLRASPGQRLCIHHVPQGRAASGALVYVHPFAEEMNKARRMAARQARALAEAGFAVLQIDLYGCGDSSGDFVDATWGHWLDDVVQAAGWMRSRHPGAPLWLWGLRAGALVATDAARHIDEACNFLFWQPVLAGKTALQQFLRLKAAAEMHNGDGRRAMDALRKALARGQSVEIAGYTVQPALARSLEQAALTLPASARDVLWLELSSAARSEAALAPASAACVETWRAAGRSVRTQMATGPAFWQTQEIEDAPALIEETLRAIEIQLETMAA